jgi:acyl-CoA thioesterase-1
VGSFFLRSASRKYTVTMNSMIHVIVLLMLAVQTNARQPVIVALGDSMTAGYGVAPESSYPAQLERELRSRGYNYRVLNHGVTGSTTTQALGRLNRALAASPDIVIIQLGGNDVSQGIPRNISRDNLRTLIERFKPGGAQLFLAGGRFPYLDELAKELNVPVIPFLEGVRGHPELLLSDGAHPTGEGYVIVVNNILKALQPFIEKKKANSPAK